MTVPTETLVQIKTVLRRIPEGDFAATAAGLIDLLGYQSDRIPPGQTGRAADFVSQFKAENLATNTEKDFIEHNPVVQVLSQVTDTEINLKSQQKLVREDSYDLTNIRSFVFASVDLEGDTYPRGKYAQFAREVNKRMSQPTVVLFRTANGRLTIAFMKRRPDKRYGKRDVLGKVSLIREIDTRWPHPAHVRIIAELDLNNRLGWMKSHNIHPDFEGLLEAWLDALDIEALNKQFYRKLFAWFENAVDEAQFPTSENPTREEHIIRLITRLLFIWFIKEKQLVHADLFNEDQIRPLLEGYDRNTGDSYYRAILQNLFFATLNTEIDQRGFNNTGPDGDSSRYHYQHEIADPERLRSLLDETPFINGGLFDCLDNPTTGDGGGLIDCFTDKAAHRGLLSVPNRLFFGPDGLFDLFDDYRFTVEENTPIEQDVALDPELLGRVFENLLAAFTPGTEVSARKRSGSYYTPRQVVDYMVTEALVAYWKDTVEPADGAPGWWEERLRYLLDYADEVNDAHEFFEPSERQDLIRNLASIKVLDPAVGSGAFPMSILHRLTLALRRLDPNNQEWASIQTEIAGERATVAFGTTDTQEREAELVAISKTFDRYTHSDYGRKLYLIQNSIYGVDIQPIACQIAKLRVFITLAIEQDVDRSADNFGIKPLPNLETRFVAANSLLRLFGQQQLATTHAGQLEHRLHLIRERYFHANSRHAKQECMSQDKTTRQELADELRRGAFDPNLTNAFAKWDPYDQNASADWFEPRYMFGVPSGFDVVIGNPPYVRADVDNAHAKQRQRIKESGIYYTLWQKWDLYIPFIERGFKLLKPRGFITLIVSDAYCHAEYARKSQDYFLEHSRIVQLDFLSQLKIFDAAVRNMTFLFQNTPDSTNQPQRRVHTPTFGQATHLPTAPQKDLTHRVFFPEDVTVEAYVVPTVELDNICYISVGIVGNAHEKRAPGLFKKDDLISDHRDEQHPKKFIEGKHLSRWVPHCIKWIEWDTWRVPDLLRRPTFPELYAVEEKLISIKMAANTPRLRVVYDHQQLMHNDSAWSFVPWHSLTGVMNRSITNRAKYRHQRRHPSTEPTREDLENTSRRFNVKYLIGVMNSSVARDHLRANRRSNIHLYPGDWKRLPIADASMEQQTPIVTVVDEILAMLNLDLEADVSEQEATLDSLVDDLYHGDAKDPH